MFTRRLLTFVPSCMLLLALAWPVGAQAQDTTSAPPPTPTQQAPEAAKQAADEWLALVDTGDYEQSWEDASSLLKEQISKEQWTAAVGQVQQQFGALQSRSLETARYTTKLPNAPEGEYVIAQYRSAFEQANAMEVAILAKEGGAWKVAGYFARPDATMPSQSDSS